MDCKSILELLIKNGESIIKSNVDKDSIFAKWYEQAESNLITVFGEDWKSFVLWDGKNISDRKQLKRAIKSIKNVSILLSLKIILEEEKRIEKMLLRKKVNDVSDTLLWFALASDIDI